MKTLVVGLGNPILGDDGVGWQVASQLQKLNKIPADVTIDSLSIGGLTLMEALIGYDRAIIIDAIVTGTSSIGSVNLYRLEDLPETLSGHTASAHDTSLQMAMRVGNSYGAQLPKEIFVVTIEAEKVYEFSSELTAPVAAAIPEALRILKELLIESIPGKSPEENHQNS